MFNKRNIPITEKDIREAFESIPIYLGEEMELMEINNSDSLLTFTLVYKNKRVWNEYTVWIRKELSLLETGEIYTTIKSQSNKNVNRTPNNTRIADRIIFYVSLYLEKKYEEPFYPEGIEAARILKHLNTKALCFNMIIASLKKENSYFTF